MEALYILFAPLCWLIIAKIWLRSTINWQEFGINVVVIVILTVATVQIGKWGATQDTEIWNGQVTKKNVDDDYYQTSYDCNCTSSTDSQGNTTTSCDTCYTDHYTRSYDGYSTVGNWTFASIDSEWRMRRDAFGPPASYTNCKVGEPASIEHGYTNYVQAVPQSLFNDTSKIAEEFAGKIPAYPKVYNFYRINRVLNVGSKVLGAEIAQLNENLNDALKTLGRTKQANIIVILTDIADPTYRYAVENAWLGGEKNDVVVFIGLDGEKIVWTDVMTWALNTGNELFHVTMRDNILASKEFNVTSLTTIIPALISQLYDRPQMKDYEYLEDEIETPTWVLVLASIFAFGGSILGTFLSHRNDLRLR